MNLIKCEKLEKSMAELQFSIDAEAFKKAVADVFKKEGKKYPVQGFRKGKAPKALIEKMYGADVFTYDAINELFPEAFEAAVKEAGVEPVGPGRYRLIRAMTSSRFWGCNPTSTCFMPEDSSWNTPSVSP